MAWDYKWKLKGGNKEAVTKSEKKRTCKEPVAITSKRWR